MVFHISLWCIKLLSLFFNTLSRFVIANCPRNNHVLISWVSHCLQWFWSLRKENLSLFPLIPHLFALKWWDWNSVFVLFCFFQCRVVRTSQEYGRTTHPVFLTGKSHEQRSLASYSLWGHKQLATTEHTEHPMLSFKPTFSCSSFTLIESLF